MFIKKLEPGRFEREARKFVNEDRKDKGYRVVDRSEEDEKLRKIANLLNSEGYSAPTMHNTWFAIYTQERGELLGAAHVTSFADNYHPGMASQVKGDVSFAPTMEAMQKNVSEGIFLDDFTISATVRRTGVGATLLKYVEDYYRDLGYKYMVLGATSKDAENFFSAQGWTSFGDGNSLPSRFFGGYYDLPMNEDQVKANHSYMAKNL